jgi:hypothetical protein
MYKRSTSVLAYARAALKEADRLSAGQSICAVSQGRQFRAIFWRVKQSRLEVVDLYEVRQYQEGSPVHMWLPVDIDADNKPLIYDEQGGQLV